MVCDDGRALVRAALITPRGKRPFSFQAEPARSLVPVFDVAIPVRVYATNGTATSPASSLLATRPTLVQTLPGSEPGQAMAVEAADALPVP